MTNDFLTMLAAAFLALVVVYALRHAVRRLFRVELPGWLMPAAIGLSMLGVTIWNEYSWYPTLRNGMPESVAIVKTVAESKPWSPWTYLVPMTVRVMAIDRAKIRHPAPGIAETELLLMQRWSPLQGLSVAYDCTNSARADLIEGAQVNADGTLTGAIWRPLDASDEGLKAACLGG